MQVDPSKVVLDELWEEAQGLLARTCVRERPNINECCASFVKFVESLRRLSISDSNCSCEGVHSNSASESNWVDGRGFLTTAADSLHMGFFQDLEILCILFDLTQQTMSSLQEWSLNLEVHHSSTGNKVDGYLMFKRRSFVSAFSVLQDNKGNTTPNTQLTRFNWRVPSLSFWLPSWNFSRKPRPPPPSSSDEALRIPIQGAEFEAAEKKRLVQEALQIGDDNLKQLRLAIMDLKGQLCRAAESLKAIFFSTESGFPNFLVRDRLKRLVHSFLTFENYYEDSSDGSVEKEDPLHEYCHCHQIHCPIGCRTAIPMAEKLVSELLDSGGSLVVGICGPRGLGKTSLASCVASNCKVKKRFVGGVYWITAGRKTDAKSLQCCLWKAISGSRAVFTSVEEGLTALKRKFSESLLPSLFILDDVWEASQVEGLLCFDGKERGRILVVTNNPQILSSTEACIYTLGCLKEEDAVQLFQWVVGWDGPLTMEQHDLTTKLATKCNGSPLFIQALSSALYGAGAHQKLALEILLNGGGEVAEEQMNTVDQSTINQATGEECMDIAESSVSGKPNSDRTANCLDSVLYACFSALGFIHPLLQECFLDLAAFPEGEWVSLSTLEKLWLAFSNGLSQEDIVVILSILVFRSMVDWRLNVLDTYDLDNELEFKLFEPFYNLASNIVCQDIKEYLKKKDSSVHETPFELLNRRKEIENENISSKCMGFMTRFLGSGNVYMNCTEDKDLKSGELVIYSKHNDSPSRLDHLKSEITLVSEARQGKNSINNTDRNCPVTRFQKEYRLFVTDFNNNSFRGVSLDETLYRATKFSIYNSNIDQFLPTLGCPFLRVGLLGGNARLSLPSSAIFTKMTQLLVLDLRGCTSCTRLPKAISALKSLQLLDLSFCTSLKSFPSSFGCLKNLRFLRISGCTSLTHLPKSTGMLTKLEVMYLSGCVKLRTLPSTIGQLSLLKILDLKGCFSLCSLPPSVGLLRELRFLDLSKCSNLSYTLPYHTQLLLLVIGSCKTENMAVPTGLWNIDQVEVLRLAYLKNMTYLPHAVGKMQHIRKLDLSNCRRLEYLPEGIGNLWLLQELDLSHTAIRKLPDSVGQLRNLLRLCLQGCCRLLCIPCSISSLPKLRCLDLSECWDLVLLPSSIGNSYSLCELVELDLTCCSFKSLPSFSLHTLPKLQYLKLVGCDTLISLPSTFEQLTSLKKIDLEGCHALTSLKGIGLGKLDKLTWLSLRNCTNLTSLPTEEMVELNSLKYLDVSGCTGLSPFPQPLLTRALEGNLTLIRWGAVWPEQRNSSQQHSGAHIE